jgi:hypothetical protein
MTPKELSVLRDRVSRAKLATENRDEAHMHADIELLAEHVVRLEIQVGSLSREVNRLKAATA